MPEYNIGVDPQSLSLTPIQGAAFRFMLDTIYDLFDGVVIWSYFPSTQWTARTSTTDPNNWWYQLRDFMTTRGLV